MSLTFFNWSGVWAPGVHRVSKGYIRGPLLRVQGLGFRVPILRDHLSTLQRENSKAQALNPNYQSQGVLYHTFSPFVVASLLDSQRY